MCVGSAEQRLIAHLPGKRDRARARYADVNPNVNIVRLANGALLEASTAFGRHPCVSQREVPIEMASCAPSTDPLRRRRRTVAALSV